MNVLVTGATGFVGRTLVSRLAVRHRIFALTRSVAPLPHDGVRWIRGDLEDAALSRLLPETVDAVVHLAQGRRYREFPAGARDLFAANVSGLMTLLEYARERGAARVLLASSANVYRPSRTALAEDAATDPATFYARSKRMAEMLAESYGECLRCLVLRLFTVYGPGQEGTLIPSLVARVRDRQPIEIAGEEGLMLSPLFVEDAARVMQTILENDDRTSGAEIFNVGGRQAVGVRDLGRWIGELLDVSPRFAPVEGDPAGWVADGAKLDRRFDVGPFVPPREGLRRVVEQSS